MKSIDELIGDTLHSLERIRDRVESQEYDNTDDIFMAVTLEKIRHIQTAIDNQIGTPLGRSDDSAPKRKEVVS